MKHFLLSIPLTFSLLCAFALPPDFAFIRRDGVATTLHATLRALEASDSPDSPHSSDNPDSPDTVALLLFDPDCGHCRHLADSLALTSTPVIAVWPSDPGTLSEPSEPSEPSELSDPNLEAYRRLCDTFPEEWTVGCDNGDIFLRDEYQWDTLPLLIYIPLHKDE